MKRMGDKGRYDASNQLRTLVVMQVLGNSKEFFKPTNKLKDTAGFFTTTKVPDAIINPNNFAQYILFGGSSAKHNALTDLQYKRWCMAEVEYQGFKISGGKLMIILPLLGTLGGGIYAGFEFWKDYTDMKQQIQEYVAPDLSGLDKKLDVLKQKMAGVEDSVVKGTDYTRDIKNDLKKDIARLEKVVDSTERRVKKSEQSRRDSTERAESRVRGYITKADDKARDSITKAEDRFDKRREQLRKNMTDLENRVNSELSALKKELDKKIKKALENPLAKLK